MSPAELNEWADRIATEIAQTLRIAVPVDDDDLAMWRIKMRCHILFPDLNPPDLSNVQALFLSSEGLGRAYAKRGDGPERAAIEACTNVIEGHYMDARRRVVELGYEAKVSPIQASYLQEFGLKNPLGH